MPFYHLSFHRMFGKGSGGLLGPMLITPFIAHRSSCRVLHALRQIVIALEYIPVGKHVACKYGSQLQVSSSVSTVFYSSSAFKMSSPPDPGSGYGQGMNTEPFNTTDPFANTHDGGDLQQNGNFETGGNTDSKSPDESESKDGSESKGESERRAVTFQEPIPQSKSNVGNIPNAGTENQDEMTMEKINIAQDEAKTAVVDKIKTAADKFHLHSIRAAGPSKIFNPTNLRMQLQWKGDDGGPLDSRPDMAVLWRSRDNRKRRNTIVVPKSQYTDPSPHSPFAFTPRFTSNLREVSKNLIRMFATFPYWDMAFWSGWSYTIGSALFVIDGALSWGPLAFPSTEFEGESTYGVPLCFFFGALFYQIGAVMAYLEAVNDGSFHGSAMRRLLDGHEDDQKKMLDEKIHGFFGHMIPHPHKHHDEETAEHVANSVDPEAGWKTKNIRRERPGSIYPTGKAPAPRRGGMDLGEAEEGESSTYLTWRWWPSWEALKTHHVYEIGFLACAIQLFGVTLYGVTAIVILPGIFGSLSPWQELAAYWVPQVVAAACFLIASIMFLLETQSSWWKPEPKVMGWWIGFWSTVGSVGFE